MTEKKDADTRLQVSKSPQTVELAGAGGATVVDIATRDPYYESRAIGSSALKEFADNPLRFYRRRIAGTEPEDPPSEAMVRGSIVDTLVTEGAEAARQRWVTVSDSIRRNSKKWNALVEEHAPRELIKQKQWDEAERIARALLSHPVACRMLTSPEVTPQWSHFWTDPDTGLQLRCRIDAFAIEHGVATDLKCWTGSGMGDAAIGRLIAKWRTHWQMELYSRGVFDALGFRPRWFLTTVDPVTEQVHLHEPAREWFEELAARDVTNLLRHIALLSERYKDEPRAWRKHDELRPTVVQPPAWVMYEDRPDPPAAENIDAFLAIGDEDSKDDNEKDEEE